MSRKLDRTIPIGRTEYIASSIAHLLVSGPPDADEENAPERTTSEDGLSFNQVGPCSRQAASASVGRLDLRSRSVAA